ncbi:MAG: hypothetical protein AAFY63_23555 [Cyanobacteria bacterium J06643_13]
MKPSFAVLIDVYSVGLDLQYVWNFPRLYRPQIVATLAQYQAKQIITLHNPRQVLTLLHSV